jgi:hypothetical protein
MTRTEVAARVTQLSAEVLRAHAALRRAQRAGTSPSFIAAKQNFADNRERQLADWREMLDWLDNPTAQRIANDWKATHGARYEGGLTTPATRAGRRMEERRRWHATCTVFAT